MKVISASKARRAQSYAATALAQIEALAADAEWQATLAAMPKGVMHR